MMTRRTPLAFLAPLAMAAALLGGCATTSRTAPVDVTRYHLGTGVSASAIQVEMLTGFAGVGAEDSVYLGAVSGALAQQGFTPGEGDTPLIAGVSYRHVPGAVETTELGVQIKRRGDGSILWEGRAVTRGTGAVAERLAKALFQGFPGQSGATITVK